MSDPRVGRHWVGAGQLRQIRASGFGHVGLAMRRPHTRLLQSHRTDRCVDGIGVEDGLEAIKDVVGDVGEVAFVLAGDEDLLGSGVEGELHAFSQVGDPLQHAPHAHFADDDG